MKTNMVQQSRDEPDQPVSSDEFKAALQKYEGQTNRDRLARAVDAVWPVVTEVNGDAVRPRQQVAETDIANCVDETAGFAWMPSYREHQRRVVIDVLEILYIEDKDVCLLSSPTGSGKSLLLNATARVVNSLVNRRAFTSTPLNSLIDQMDDDEFLDDIITVKGRNNYQCIHPSDSGTPVDEAICQTESDFDCRYKDQPHTSGGCPYYGRVYAGQTNSNVVTNLSYLMANSMIPSEVDAGFSERELMLVDEIQSVEDFALLFVGFTVGEHNVPVDWDRVPNMPGKRADQETVIEWIENDLLRVVTEQMEELSAKEETGMMASKEKEQLDDLRRFNQKVANFLGDVREHEWAMTHDMIGGKRKIEFEPITVGRFLHGYLWSQSHKIVCSSATIPPSFTEEVGLDSMDVGRVDVPSTFPNKRRPVITSEAVGKMTMSERDKTIPKMADQIGRIADVWAGHKGIVHCNSYKIAERLYDRLPNDVQRRTQLQDGDDREGSLASWVDQDPDESSRYRDGGGQLFLSVGMEEGVSLDHDQSRFNIIAKAPYEYLGDDRVSCRVNDRGEFKWYVSKMLIDVMQASGRTMRAKDDWCATYILDKSAVDGIHRNTDVLEGWFKESVDVELSDDVPWPE